MKKSYRLACLSVLYPLLMLLFQQHAFALPSYARQTGEACVACHVSFPELTPYGRLFKLSGYTLGTTQLFPVAAMAVASVSKVSNTQGNDSSYPRNNALQLEGGSLFIAGKVGDHVGMFSQWTYNNLNSTSQADGSTTFSGKTTVDNNDWRLSGHLAKANLDLIYGLTLNNNPTVQDAWNSTPAFGYPYQSSRLAGVWGIGPQTTLIEGGLAQQVAGLSAYAFLNKNWYAEIGSYHVADGPFSFLSHGVDLSNRLSGNNPYWRFAYNRDWGLHSLAVGVFGMDANVHADSSDTNSPLDHYHDRGIDMQYQYLSDPHIFTSQLSYIHETTDWDASHVGNDRATANSKLNSIRAKASYWYQHTYGLSLGYFGEHGTTDWTAWSNTGSPDTTGYMLEFDYMIKPYWRVGLQYTAFMKYQGASHNYDGNGRNARDNNTTYLYTWIAF